MHPMVNHMLQLQEMNLIRAEQKTARKKADLASLDKSIKEMTSELPKEVGTLYQRLQKKDPIVLIPISNSFCAGCGMRLPISLVQSVRQAHDIHQCPTCAKILYYPEDAPRRIGKRPRRSEPRKVGISRFSSHTLMLPRLKATERDDAIIELSNLMAEAGFIDNPDRMAEESIRRENVVSTAMEHGTAFPHVRGVEGGGITVAMGISKKGIKFDPSSKKLTRIIFLISIPTAASAFYLKLLAGLTSTLTSKDARDALMAEKDPEKLWKTLVKLTRTTIK